MDEVAEQWINRYLDAYLAVSRNISAQIRDSIAGGLTTDQYLILRLINGKERCTSTYLAESFAVGKSSITAISNRLVDAGLLVRTRDENDRRQVYLSMTEQGREVFEVAGKHVMDTVSPYFSHFGEKEIENFIMMFERLARMMQDSGGKDD
ncbi:MarR family transcriptional regulator [Bacillus sp. FJAT-27264]|nr:MarR family transcriptional regulator [Bacillus sp. FJAT-27264]OBZ14491.1 MarR family transcriptional regulator [Bacillus sp. FJAT-27264]